MSADDGHTWVDADLEPAPDRHAWQRFTCHWEATDGEHYLRVRAHDASGRVQGDEPAWSTGGFANNADEAVRVVVMEEPPR